MPELRRLFCTVLFAALLALVPARTGAAEPARGFTILQVNDTYKIEGLEAGGIGGMARLRTLRRELEAGGREVVVLHAGDVLFPSVMSKYFGGAAMVDTLNLLDGSAGFDPRLFVAFGNHEFDPRDPRVLFERLRESRFTWLSADTGYRLEGMAAAVPFAGHAPNVAATALIEVGGVRLGLFGLMLPADPRPWASYSELETRLEIARSAVGELRARGAEVVVALTHQSLTEDTELALRIAGIDWIAGGHEHVRLERFVGAVGISKADADARTVVRIDVDAAAGRFTLRPSWIDLDRSVEQDPALLGKIAEWLVRLDQEVFARTGRRLLDVVATSENRLEGAEPVIRGRESALGNFLADVLRDRLETDLGLVYGGAIRVNDDVPAGGELRVYELEGIFYYDNEPVAVELTGAQILDLLRKSVSQAEWAHGRFLQVSGLRFRYHATTRDGSPAARVEAGEVEVRGRPGDEWRPLELDRTYSVATLDYLIEEGCRDGYVLFSAGCGGVSPARSKRLASTWREVTEEAIARLPGRRITTAISERIVRIEGE